VRDSARRLLLEARRARFAARGPDGRAGDLPSLFVLSDPARLPDPRFVMREAPGDVAVILRHYGDPHRAALARDLARARHPLGPRLVIAGDSDLASAVRADGIHWPEGLWRTLPRAALGRGHFAIVTGAAHSRLALAFAARIGLGAALLSPVFPTKSHPGAPSLGAAHVRALVRTAEIPVYALGGVTATTARVVKNAGLTGFAAIGGWSE